MERARLQHDRHRHHRGARCARQGRADLLGAPFKVLSAVRAARRVLRQRQPRAVISFGGFAAGPGGLAARLAGVPLVVHEQNRAPGMTNRVLAKFAGRVLTGFPDTFAGANEEVVGNPVRAEIAAIAPPEQRFGGRDGALRLLVLGGSQARARPRAAVPKALAAWRGVIDFEVRHQCGEKLRDEAVVAYADAGIAASVEPFIADMAGAYAWADVGVPPGALTLAELCAVGVASVLVPFPQAVDDHQTKNARYLVDRGVRAPAAAGRLLVEHPGATSKSQPPATCCAWHRPRELGRPGRRPACCPHRPEASALNTPSMEQQA
jgi:UDP-N-acetylglucosamine--N-acetylmuramyl-(pentapeptide) pyrophosphoryl-undecaprenol N-acetylglucosamine transferase